MVSQSCCNALEDARELLEEARARAASILRENRVIVESLRDLLLDKKVLDAKALNELVPGANEGKKPRKSPTG